MEDIHNPVNAIRRLYAAKPHDASGDNFGVKDHFTALASSSGTKIPLLTMKTVDILPNNSLVRFRGMVQDMLNPEYYVGEFKSADGTWHTSKYSDCVDETITQDTETRLAERKPVLLIPVPNETSWVKSIHEADTQDVINAAAQPSAATKRGRDDGDGDDDMSMSEMPSGITTGVLNEHGEVANKDTAASKARLLDKEKKENGAAGTTENLVKQSIDELPEGSCMVYIYDEDLELKLNDIVEIVGVVSRVPELAAAHMDNLPQQENTENKQEENGNATMEIDDGAPSLLDQEILASHFPTSKALRIHAILLKPEDKKSTPTTTAFSATNTAADNVALAKEGRARALGFLSMVLGGDDLAAQYLLLQLVSRVHCRTSTMAGNASTTSSVVGTLPLNVTNCPSIDTTTTTTTAVAGNASNKEQKLSSFGGAVAAAVGALFPRVLSVGLTIDGLNAKPWWPRRDQSTLRMLSGPLQLASGTQVLLDETVMSAGQLREVGLRNLSALQDLMRRQQVSYDFEFFNLDQPADAPVTIFSTGKTLLKGVGEVEIPLKPTAPVADTVGIESTIRNADLEPARAYLAAARSLDFKINEDVGKFLETELATAKAKDSEHVNQETFHRWLNVARLLAVSYGESELTVERWQEAMSLEKAREERLAVASK